MTKCDGSCYDGKDFSSVCDECYEEFKKWKKKRKHLLNDLQNALRLPKGF